VDDPAIVSDAGALQTRHAALGAALAEAKRANSVSCPH